MKKLVTLLLAVLLLTVFADFGLAEDITLDVIIAQYGPNTNNWFLGNGMDGSNFVKKFEEANPGIKLNLEVVSWNDVYTVVDTRIASNQAPDILNIDVFANYANEGLLEPVSQYCPEELYNDFFPSFIEQSVIDGTVWAVPDLASARALYYNVDMFEEVGIEVPTTWAELEDVSQAIIDYYDGEVYPWGIDMTTDEGQAAFAYYTWGNGGGFVDADGNWALNSAENVEAVEFIAELYKSGYCNANPATDTRYPLQDSFNAGSLPMMIGPFNMITADTTVNYQVADLPSQTGAPVSLGVCDQLMVFKDESAKDQAARTAAISKFFDAFYELETYAGYMVYEGFLPATSDASELLATSADKFTDCNGAAGRSEFFATFCGKLPACQFYPMQKAEWMDVRNGVIDVEQQVSEGLKTAQDALDALQAKVS